MLVERATSDLISLSETGSRCDRVVRERLFWNLDARYACIYSVAHIHASNTGRANCVLHLLEN